MSIFMIYFALSRVQTSDSEHFFFEKCSYDHETQNNAKISDLWDIKISHLLNMEGVGYTFLGP